VVPKGEARKEAEALANRLAAFPQVCLRGDRLSAYEQIDLSLRDALRNELLRGTGALHTESVEGAKRFTAGAGRHGSFEDGSSG
jgi:enoyl-CoA hydratase